SLLFYPFAVLLMLSTNPLGALGQHIISWLTPQLLRKKLERELGIATDRNVLGKTADRNAAVIWVACDLDHLCTFRRLALEGIPWHVALDHHDDIGIFYVRRGTDAKMKIVRVGEAHERACGRYHRRHQRFGK